MNAWKRTLSLGLLALGLLLTGKSARAASTTTASLSIDVTVNASVGVSINGAVSSTDTATVVPGGSPVVSVTSVTVINTATGGILEFWKLNSTNTSNNASGSAFWTLVTSTFGASGPATDSYAIQALFVSSNAVNGTCSGLSNWGQGYAPGLTYSPVYYTTNGSFGFFADQTTVSGANGNPDITTGVNINRMRPSAADGSGKRGLCYRIVPPTSVSAPDNQVIYITVTAASS